MTSAAVTQTSLDELQQFWAKHHVLSRRLWPDATLPGASGKDMRAVLAAQQSRRLLQEERTLKIVLRRHGEVAGLACLIPLDWDSEQFGFPAARLEIVCAHEDHPQSLADRHELLERISDLCRRQSVCHLTARVDADELVTIHSLEHSGFELIDGIQTLSVRLPAPGPEAVAACDVRLYRTADLDQILEIARTAYVCDRFHSDSALSTSKADRINEAWVRNCCLGRMADAVIVGAYGDTVLGYVTCKIDTEATRLLGAGCGVIGMVATAAAARNTGVALAASRGALDWFHRHGAAAVEVGTQLRNIAAGKLYERCGFRLARVSLTFRKWIGDGSAIVKGISHAI
jgi:GNAT superfamily N-acetyltransferase